MKITDLLFVDAMVHSEVERRGTKIIKCALREKRSEHLRENWGVKGQGVDDEESFCLIR
jgi:hypothetical protein